MQYLTTAALLKLGAEYLREYRADPCEARRAAVKAVDAELMRRGA